jgi:hypothetical protein
MRTLQDVVSASTSKHDDENDLNDLTDFGADSRLSQISTLTNFFATRHLSEGAARDAHRRVYSSGEGEDAGNKTLGGAAAYQAYL